MTGRRRRAGSCNAQCSCLTTEESVQRMARVRRMGLQTEPKEQSMDSILGGTKAGLVQRLSVLFSSAGLDMTGKRTNRRAMHS